MAGVVGYQLVYGFGVGMGFMQPSYVVQTILPITDVPIGVIVITLVQNISAGEMQSRLAPLVPAQDASGIFGSGLALILASMPPGSREQAVDAISTSIVMTVYVSLALSAASVVGCGVKWASMKQGNPKDEAVKAEGAEDLPAAVERQPNDTVTRQEREGQTSMKKATTKQGE
ncbi:hypothetical protein SLS53_006414 [Cytospora paraplurivora]|uniref:Uncharacterized protein n=1 Tax=Cytospora paraplurivora TaxID=2898453 RepID=A0AAN9U3P4_9PEZI